MAKRCFQLKRSRLAVLFQLIMLIVLIGVLQQLLSLGLWLLFSVLAIMALIYSLSQPWVQRFEYLDQQQWSLLHSNSAQVVQVSMRHIIDHQVYMVIYFDAAQHKPVLIWRDQLSVLQWKGLKNLAHVF